MVGRALALAVGSMGWAFQCPFLLGSDFGESTRVLAAECRRFSGRPADKVKSGDSGTGFLSAIGNRNHEELG
jgi:hypothetical protein